MYDIVIIGAGINGSMLAYALSKTNARVLVVEKRSDSGLEQSMSNSAIIHSGIDPEDGTLKKEMNLSGSKLMKQLCFDLDIEYQEIGAIICATNEEQDDYLKELIKKAQDRRIEHRYLKRDLILKSEPHLSDQVISGLSLPTTAIVYPFEITTRLIQIAKLNKIDVLYNCEVEDIINHKEDGYYEIFANDKTFNTKIIVNASGNNASIIADMVQVSHDFEIVHKRGEYFVTDNDFHLTNSILYPVPSKVGKGVLVVPTVHGNYLLGPNSVSQKNSDDSNHNKDLDFVKNEVGKLISIFPEGKVIKKFSGVRSTSSTKDFHIKIATDTKNFINVACIDSPGLSSSPAIALHTVELIKKMIDLDVNKNHITKEEVKINTTNKKIICKCERVTKGDIINAVRGVNASKSLVGTRFRSRATAGICQGSRCEAMVINIMARELNIDPSEITRYDQDTYVVRGSDASL